MLDNDRQHYITASQAHRVMAGFELELEGLQMEAPEEPEGFLDWLKGWSNKPLVGTCKDSGFKVSGQDIAYAWKYLKATTPVFSEGMESVAREIAMSEFIVERDECITTKDMERGNLQEGEAVAALEALTGIQFDNTTEDQRFITDGALGATPDGIHVDGFEITECCEVKNPKDATHMKYLTEITDQESMLSIKPEYYWQCQCGLAATGAHTYHWMSYHNHFIGRTRCVYVPVTRNEEHITILRQRAARVMQRVPEIIEFIKSRYEQD